MKKILVLLFMLVSIYANAQTDTLKLKHFGTWGISPYLGLTFENTDVSDNDPIYTNSNTTFGWGINGSRQLSHFASLHANFFNTKLKGEGDLFAFKSSLNQLDLRFQFNITNGLMFRSWRSTQIYGYVGYGILWYDVNRTNKLANSSGVIASGSTRVIPSGLGVKYRLGNRTNVYLDFCYTQANTDNLEGYKVPLTTKDGYTRLVTGITYTFGQKKILEWDNPYAYLVPESVHDTTVVIKTIKYEAPPKPEVIWPDSATVYFSLKSYSLEIPYLDQLDSVIENAVNHDDDIKHIRISAYCDTIGSDRSNKILVNRRANSVAKYVNAQILKKTGIDVSALTSIELNDESSALYVPDARNRKVVVKIMRPTETQYEDLVEPNE